MIILLAKKVVFDYKEAYNFLKENKKVINIKCDQKTFGLNGEILTLKNYDEKFSNYLKYDHNYSPVLYCDVQCFKNGSTINLKKGEYEVGIIQQIINQEHIKNEEIYDN